MFSNLDKLLARAAKDLVQDVPHLLMNTAVEGLQEIRRLLLKALLGIEEEREEKPDVKLPRALLSGDVPFGRAMTKWARRTVYFRKGDNRHKVVVGANGTGKTEWAKNYVVNREGGVCYLDNTDGMATESILKALPEHRLEKTVVLDHGYKEYPLPMGVYRADGGIFAEDVLTAQWVSFFESNFGVEGQYMTVELISYACKAVFSLQSTTILDVIRLVQDDQYREWVLNRIRDRDTIKWWRERYERLSESEQKQIRASFLRRAGLLMQDRVLRYTLGYPPKEPLPYRKWMDEGWTVLIRAPESLPSGTVRTIMALHALNFWRAALSRDNVPESKRRPFMLIADEPQTWLSKNADTLDDIFSKARKYGFGITCLFQSFKQVSKESPALLRIMLDNHPDLIVFRTSREQLPTPTNPEELQKYHFLARIDGSEWIHAKSLGAVKYLRQNIIPIIQQSRDRWNMHHETIKYEMDRRERLCRDEGINTRGQRSGSRRRGLGHSSYPGSQSETSESSDSYTIFD